MCGSCIFLLGSSICDPSRWIILFKLSQRSGNLIKDFSFGSHQILGLNLCGQRLRSDLLYPDFSAFQAMYYLIETFMLRYLQNLLSFEPILGFNFSPLDHLGGPFFLCGLIWFHGQRDCIQLNVLKSQLHIRIQLSFP